MSGFDTVIVGAGTAGLTAATYLARFRRRVLVLDGGPSRAQWIPTSHNTPGFPHGVNGAAFLERLRDQAQAFGAVIRDGLVESLAWRHGAFRVWTSVGREDARTVLLATGVADRLPPLDGIEAAIHDSRVRMCPICDAYEAIDRRLAVLGNGPLAEREFQFLRTYSADVTLLALDGAETSSSANVMRVQLTGLKLTPEGLQACDDGGARHTFDYLYLALGCAPQAELAVGCGAAQDELGALLVNAHQMTSVDGLYAAGDVVRGLNQIAVATGEAAIAATDIHNRLRAAGIGVEPQAATA